MIKIIFFMCTDLKQALLILECGTTHEEEKVLNGFKNQQTFTPIVHGYVFYFLIIKTRLWPNFVLTVVILNEHLYLFFNFPGHVPMVLQLLIWPWWQWALQIATLSSESMLGITVPETCWSGKLVVFALTPQASTTRMSISLTQQGFLIYNYFFLSPLPNRWAPWHYGSPHALRCNYGTGPRNGSKN